MSTLEADQFLRHFSHQHPLELVNFHPAPTQKTTCSCCNCEASGWLYHCTVCTYSLHRLCSKLPRTLTHMIDENHKLTLLSSPAYPEGSFVCDACGSSGTGFCYHCKECQIDLHPICAFMPSKIDHSAHNHTLNLCFSPPYDKKTFDCDICLGSGSDHWLYRCDSCEFDAHVTCAMAKTQPQTISANPRRQEKPQLATNNRFSPPQVPHDQPDLGIPYIQTQRNPIPLNGLFSDGAQVSPIPYIKTQHNPVPRNGLFSDGAQVYTQIDRYLSSPIMPNHVQPPPRRNNLVNEIEMIGSAVEGITGTIAQLVVQGALGSS
ncbi:protein VACUOLELESS GAMETOPHYTES-like [Actinidia eriantha]|uniref:protein VACUOLELESS GAMETOPHYTES-like n=1 Tax=Actinidia eriantha TaxID=165200 RepID=UPI00258A97EE|nr:protein VACUOLELESS GAMETOPHYTES-like [Actinidia eriantha]